MWLTTRTGTKHHAWRLHTQFELDKHVPLRMDSAIIACMLISLTTGRKPTLRTYEMICYYFTGLADEDELLAHLAKWKNHDA